jgi:hypothetical protein
MCQPGRPSPHGALQRVSSVHLVDVAARQRPVLGQRAHAEVDVAVRRVGVAGVDQRLDQVDDRLDELRCQRLGVRAADPDPLGVLEVVLGHLLGQFGRGPAGLGGRVVDLVVDVRDICHERHVVALVLEEALQLGEDDERPGVADVHARVDRRAARVDADLARIAGLQWRHFAGSRVIQRDLAHAGECTRRIPG